MKKVYVIIPEKCISCGTCDVQCSFGAILISDRGKFSVDYEKCTSCGICFRDCPVDAIVLTENELIKK